VKREEDEEEESGAAALKAFSGEDGESEKRGKESS
jgi:hypothetical protein